MRSLRHLLDLLRGPRGTLVILAIVGLILIGGVATAFAVGGDREGDSDKAPALKGSVPAPKDDSSDDEAGEAQELQKLTKIDQSTAEKAALQAIPGTAKSTKLDNENGFVVYEVEIAGDDGQTHQVKVDAGNGTVLQQDTGEENGSGEGDEEGSR